MTTADLYCTRADVTEGLAPGAIESRGGLVASCLSATDTITYEGHGYETGTAVTVRASESEGSVLPSPLVAGTLYYVIRLTHATFKLATSEGNALAGVAIDFTSNGVEMRVAREPQFDEVIEFYSRWADGFFPAHAVPFGRTEAVPRLVREVVAKCARAEMLRRSGKESKPVTDAELEGKAILERYAAGMPIRGVDSLPEASNLAVASRADTTTELGEETIP